MSEVALKKEFDVVWYKENVYIHTDTLRKTSKGEYFNGTGHKAVEAILPEGMHFMDIMAFQGKRTRVTVEVIPW